MDLKALLKRFTQNDFDRMQFTVCFSINNISNLSKNVNFLLYLDDFKGIQKGISVEILLSSISVLKLIARRIKWFYTLFNYGYLNNVLR